MVWEESVTSRLLKSGSQRLFKQVAEIKIRINIAGRYIKDVDNDH